MRATCYTKDALNVYSLVRSYNDVFGYTLFYIISQKLIELTICVVVFRNFSLNFTLTALRTCPLILFAFMLFMSFRGMLNPD